MGAARLGHPEILDALRASLPAGSLLRTELRVADLFTPDAVLCCDVLHAYEIKGEGDSLRRLLPPEGHQLAGYVRCFPRVTAVCARRHVRALLDLVPAWWGITVAEREGGVVLREEWPGTDHEPERPLAAVPQHELARWARATLGLRGKTARDPECVVRVSGLEPARVAAAVLRSRDWSEIDTSRVRRNTTRARMVCARCGRKGARHQLPPDRLCERCYATH